MINIICLIFCLITFSSINATIERRVAIDVGSGSTKVAIADVDVENQQIVTLLEERSFPVAYQASLDRSSDATFDEEVIKKSLATFQEIKEICQSYEATRITAVATSAFRKAENSQTLLDQVSQATAIQVKIIPQGEEGEIAFFSAVATGQFSPNEIVVWDIGTGSLQMTTQNDDTTLAVYRGEEMGSASFKAYIMEEIQKKNLNETDSPNPMNDDDFYFASSYARSFARHAYPIIKKKIQNVRPVLGIGRLFNNSLKPIAEEGSVILRKDLRHFIIAALHKSDEELDNPFANVDVSNSILALAIMKALHIHAIYPVDTTSTKGILVYPSYWN